MSDERKFSAGAPEVRALAQMAGIKPARLAAFVNDVWHARDNITPAEAQRLMDGFGRFLLLVGRINTAIKLAKEQR